MRRGVGDEGAGAAEGFSAGDESKLAVEGDGGGFLQIARRQGAGAGWAFELAEGSAVGGDGDGFVDGLDGADRATDRADLEHDRNR